MQMVAKMDELTGRPRAVYLGVDCFMDEVILTCLLGMMHSSEGQMTLQIEGEVVGDFTFHKGKRPEGA